MVSSCGQKRPSLSLDRNFTLTTAHKNVPSADALRIADTKSFQYVFRLNFALSFVVTIAPLRGSRLENALDSLTLVDLSFDD